MNSFRSILSGPSKSRHLFRLLCGAGVAVIVSIWALSSYHIYRAHEDAWSTAQARSSNLLQILERVIYRDIEMYDLSLIAVVERLRNPVLESVYPEARQLSIFDRTANAPGFGSILVLDENGNAFIDSGSVIPRRLNGSDRRYFLAQKENPETGLFIGRPWQTRISGRGMIPMSRRFAYADGAFAGVVVGAIETKYFDDLFKKLNNDPNLQIELIFNDKSSDRDAGQFDQFPNNHTLEDKDIVDILKARFGEFLNIEKPSREGRMNTYAQVGSWPIYIVISTAISAINSAWYGQALIIISIAGTITLAIVAFSMLLYNEFGRRMRAEAELEKLTITDALTGVSNRRHFEQELSRVEGLKATKDISVILIDVDFFKKYNDLYGHPAGDQVLKNIGQILAGYKHHNKSTPFRIGGEEFALILIGTPEAEAIAIAEDVLRSVKTRAIVHQDSSFGIVTLSLGVLHNARFPLAGASEWLSLADEALYKAKNNGRNCICVSGSATAAGRLLKSNLKIIDGKRQDIGMQIAG